MLVLPLRQNNICDDVSQDDRIVLNSCGIKSHWKVPVGMLQCPNARCEQTFKMRTDLIRHFKENHAEGSILCYVCQRPIRALQFDQYERHYRRRHPFIKVPFTGGGQDEQLNSEELTLQLGDVRTRMLACLTNTLLIAFCIHQKLKLFIQFQLGCIGCDGQKGRWC